MAIPVINTATGSTAASVNAVTWTHTGVAGNLLVVGFLYRDLVNHVQATCNGTPMALINSASDTTYQVGWYKTSTINTGANTITITPSAAGSRLFGISADVSSFDSSQNHQFTMSSNAVSAISLTPGITSTTNDMAFIVGVGLSTSTNITSGSGQTCFFQVAEGPGPLFAIGQYKNGSASNTSFTLIGDSVTGDSNILGGIIVQGTSGTGQATQVVNLNNVSLSNARLGS